MHAGNRLYVEATLNPAQDFRGPLFAGRQNDGPTSCSRCSAISASRCRTSRRRAGSASRHGVIDKCLQDPLIDQDVSSTCQTFSIKDGGTVGQGICWIIDQGDVLVGHSLTESSFEEGAPLDDGFSRERASKNTEDGRRHSWVKDHSRLHRRDLCGAKHSHGTLNRLA